MINLKRNIFKTITITLIIIIILTNFTATPIISKSCSPIQNILDTDKKVKSTLDISYDLLIISPKKFAWALKPLVDHKEIVGVATNLVTLDEIYDEMFLPGQDNPEKIKYFIKKAIEEWGIKYVLLVGDFRKIPVRYVYNEDPWPTHPEPCFISELYYADIYDENGSFSSWDTNNNGVYGEWSGDEAQDKDIDLYPDVYVGRLACRNNLEVRIMVKKIITYERKTYDTEWFNRIVVVAGNTDPYFSGNEGEENTRTALGYMQGFENTTLWASDGSLTEPEDVIKAINKGCGFLYFDGHSNTRVWCTHPPDDNKMISGLSTLTMNYLRNKDMLPVCLVAGCNTLQFDVNILNLLKNFKESWNYATWVPECWGWKLTRKISGGSIATIGGTAVRIIKENKESFEGASDYLYPQFFYEYGVNGTDILGEAWGKAITNYLHNYPINWSTPAAWDYAYDAKTLQQWVLFGDPSLKIGGYYSLEYN